MGDRCDICGDIGVVEAIVTCIQCEINREHVYCMRTVQTELPVKSWICEECEDSARTKRLSSNPDVVLAGSSKSTNAAAARNDSATTSGNKHIPKGSQERYFGWEKRVPSGKTKYIPVKEALKLPSGVSSSPKFTPHPRDPRLTMRSSKPRKPSYLDLGSGRQSPSKAPRQGSLGVPRQCLQQSRVLLDALSPTPNSKPKEQSSGVSTPQKKASISDVETSRSSHVHSQALSPKPKLKEQSSGVPTPQKKTSISGVNAESSTSAENAKSIPDSSDYTPALMVLWRGSFRVNRHEKLNQEIEVHPPSVVLKKICEFCSQIPKVLEFQAFPYEEIWNQLFEDCAPDERDIGLYFFPPEGLSSHCYASLVKSITSNKFALRTRIEDVELVIFTSKLLPEKVQRWKGNYYIWGVFRRLKNEYQPGTGAGNSQ